MQDLVVHNTFIGFVAFDEDEELFGACGTLARAGVARRSRSCDDLNFRRARIEPLELQPLELPRRRAATAFPADIAAASEANAAHHGARPAKTWADIVRNNILQADVAIGSAGAKVLESTSAPPSDGESTSLSEIDSTPLVDTVCDRSTGTPRSALSDSNRSTSTRPQKTLRWADDESTCSTTSQPSPNGSDDDMDPTPCDSWTPPLGGNRKEEMLVMHGSMSDMEDSELVKYIMTNPGILAQLRQQMRDCSPGDTPTDVGSLKQFCRNWVNSGK